MEASSVRSQQEIILKRKIIRALKEHFVSINPHLHPIEPTKQVYRKLQERSCLEQLSFHKKFLKNFVGTAKMFCRDGLDISPEEIKLELREVKCRSLEDAIFPPIKYIRYYPTGKDTDLSLRTRMSTKEFKGLTH